MRRTYVTRGGNTELDIRTAAHALPFWICRYCLRTIDLGCSHDRTLRHRKAHACPAVLRAVAAKAADR